MHVCRYTTLGGAIDSLEERAAIPKQDGGMGWQEPYKVQQGQMQKSPAPGIK